MILQVCHLVAKKLFEDLNATELQVFCVLLQRISNEIRCEKLYSRIIK